MSNDLPPVIDVRDALSDIEASADADVSGEVETIRASLAELAGRERAGQQSVLDDIDGHVLAMREDLAGDADRRAEAIQNRIRTYRNTLREASETLSLSGAELTDRDRRIDVSTHGGGTATLGGTLVNGGSARATVVSLVFHDTDGEPMRTVESREVGLDPDEHRDVEWTVYVPDGAAYYTTAALDADDPRSVSDEAAGGVDSA